MVRSSDNKELHLTAFEPALRSAIIGELHSLTESEVGEMLLLENIMLQLILIRWQTDVS